ncbi:MAG: hypothetical protein C0524_00325 [Rhodobacter sp.]|nr:hypothetical protein [Rhodobacter sp.]
MTAGSAALVVGLLFTNMKSYATLLRADKELLGAVQPLALMSGALRCAKMMLKSTRIELLPTGTGARPGAVSCGGGQAGADGDRRG